MPSGLEIKTREKLNQNIHRTWKMPIVRLSYEVMNTWQRSGEIPASKQDSPGDQCTSLPCTSKQPKLIYPTRKKYDYDKVKNHINWQNA